jgi:hypothetical protein
MLRERKFQSMKRADGWAFNLFRLEPSRDILKSMSNGIKSLAFGILSSDYKDSYEFSELLNERIESLSESEAQDLIKKLSLHIDDSPYTSEEWSAAIHTVLDWLQSSNLKSSFQDILSYLSCCSESQDKTGLHLDFTKVVTDFLNESGFERAKPA